MERGVELQPFLNNGYSQPQDYEYYDWCFNISNVSKNSYDKVSPEEVNSHILDICVARDPDVHFSYYDEIQSLDPVYDLQDCVGRETTKEELRNAIITSFCNWLTAIGCATTTIHGDTKDSVFLLVRLRDAACSRLAEKHLTPLQIDSEATPYLEFVEDPDYVAPYAVYHHGIENITKTFGAMKAIGRIWTRYDMLSKPIKEKIFHLDNREISLFRDIDRIRLLYNEVRSFWNMGRMNDHKYFNGQPFVLHQMTNLNALIENWAQINKVFSFSQPLDEIRNYYGEEIAFYFAFKQLYAQLLRWPAFLGMMLFIFQMTHDPDLNFKHYWLKMARIGYGVFLCSWVTWFHQHWARKELILRVRWGIEVGGVKQLPLTRHAFVADGWRRSPIFPDKWEKYQSMKHLRARQAITALVCCAATALCVFILNDDLQEVILHAIGYDIKSGLIKTFEYLSSFILFGWICPQFGHTIGTLVFGSIVKLLDNLWKKKAAQPLADFENIQYEDQYDDSVAIKLFSFKFMDHFSSLFYFAFFKEYIQPCTGMESGSCLLELRSTLVTLFAFGIMESLKAAIKPMMLLANRRVTAGKLLLGNDVSGRVEKQFYKEEYISKQGLINDWLDTMVQFGLLSLFSMVMPILPIIAIVANLIDIRMDAIRITKLYRRPFPRPAGDLGFWSTVVRLMGFLAVLSNILLCVFVGFRHRSMTFKLIFCLSLLLAAFILREYIQWKLPQHSRRADWLLKRMRLTTINAMWGEDVDGPPPSTTASNVSPHRRSTQNLEDYSTWSTISKIFRT